MFVDYAGQTVLYGDAVDDRADRRDTVIAAQLPIEHWHGWIGEPTVADAILDRLLHHAHRLTLKGESLRTRHPQAESPASNEFEDGSGEAR